MCTIPPVPTPPPPPPPPLSLPIHESPSKSPKEYYNDQRYDYSDICEWATDHTELWEACAKNKICLHDAPYKYKYNNFESILQVGPTCGLVALSMLIKGDVSPLEMLNITKMEGFSNNGEMFSCRDMLKLTQKVFSLAEIENLRYYLVKGGLYSHEIIEKLLNGALLLVPYDADFNHSPCLKQGHKAHWTLVCGVIIIKDPGETYDSDPSNVYVLCKHGKSRYLAAWSLDELDKSNKNLWEFSPKRGEDGLIYILPEGGVGGENGLRDQFLLFENV